MPSQSRLKPLHKRLLGPPYHQVRRVLSRLHPRRVRNLARWLLEVARAVRRRRRDPRLTVAVDISPLWEPLTGIGWYLYRLIEHLADREDLALRLYGPTLASAEKVPPPVVPPPEGPALERVVYAIPEDTSVHPDRLIRILRRLERWLIAADGNRVLFAPNYLPTARFAVASGALVATVHDLAFRLFPWTVGEETLDLLSRHLPRTLREAVRIVTPSEAVRRELAREGLAPPERIRAIHHGSGQLSAAGPVRRPAWAPERFALFVGTLEPRKNLETLLAAWRLLLRRLHQPPALVVCGRFGWKDEGLRREIEAGVAEGWLHQPGYVANEELAALFRSALFLAFPSHYEGFGLPILEAFSAGTPVLASDLPVLREVAGEAALFAPPDRPEAWAERGAELASDPALRKDLIARGRERVARFSWRRSAELHAEVFRDAVDGPTAPQGNPTDL